jgi:uncharacterized protein (TIGR02246 family)
VRIATVLACGFLCVAAHTRPSRAQGPAGEAEVRAAVAAYNRAFTSKDLPALKALLASDVVLYEHSVQNIGLDDVWEHHLQPEVAAFEGTRAEFTDVRVWVEGGVALVTRQYHIRATMNGKPVDARGNETMGWARRDGEWRVVHIHYSHPCPRPPTRQP